MINSSNIVLITTTLSNNKISEMRRNNIINNFSKWNIPIILNHGIVNKTLSSNNIMFKIIINAFDIFKKYNTEFAIICDDDFYPIDNFLEELNNTVELLPYNWRCLHLCPGYLWGRKFRDINKVSQLNPEYDMTNIDFDETGRFYINCNSKLYSDKKFWMGGPIAILVNKKNLESFIYDFTIQYNICNENNDVVFTKILNDNDYVCRSPLLGFEKEEGGTTFT